MNKKFNVKGVIYGAIALIMTFLMPFIKNWVKDEFEDVSNVTISTIKLPLNK